MIAENMIIIAPILNMNIIIENDRDNFGKMVKKSNLKQPTPQNQTIFKQPNPIKPSPYYLGDLRINKIPPHKPPSGEF
jgi:hypothetical protein